ncbi:hemolysin family protein [Acetobacter suratthaniensis]|uniref:Polyamine export protein n=1 Tax=Acetobacter suratthaniensis TaxID=1502841 RepID=A0ABS3LK77_9PROT|nr:hemolysin family protein [Acetobacter suratthaniensis]MBO1328012.1 HlyC/CorC family transporter [Acetobacter suratthaniensis]MCX2566149.1 hemolysin family protein [Acetobacter suratthaniensis]
MLLFIMGLLALALLIAVSVLISLSEISFAAARDVRLRSQAEAGNRKAQAFLALRRNSGQVMTVIQICLNGVGILGGIVSSEMLTPPLTAFMLQWHFSEWWAQNLASAFSFLFVTGVFVLFADLLPKRVAMNDPNRVALAIGWFPRVALRVLYPFVWTFSRISDAVLHALKIPAASAVEPVTPEDLRAILAAGTVSGALLQQEHQMISNVLALQDRAVTSAMTPRDEIVFLDIQDTPEHNYDKVRAAPYSRYPLCNGGLDKVIGSIRSEDVLASVVDPNAPQAEQPRGNPIARLRRDVLSVPETLHLWDTLAQFDSHGTGFALVVNEYGLMVGLITFKDIMGVLMDGVASPFEEQAIVRRDENSWLVDGAAPIGDVMRELAIVALPDHDQFDTISGFIMHRLRRMARKTDRVDASGFRFEVVDVEGFRINQLLVTRLPDKLPA